MSKKRIAAYVLPPLLVVSAVVVTNAYTNSMIARSSEMRALSRKYQARFVADVGALDADPPFPDGPRAKNAEPFLREHLSWVGHDLEKTKDDEKLQHDFEAYPKWETEASVRRRLLADQAFFARYDSAWVERLNAFDHLNLATHPVHRAELEKLANQNGVARIGTLATLPLPDYSSLRRWGLYHALKLSRTGRARKGLALLRQIGRLSHSSYNLIGSMIAVTMLNSERFMADDMRVRDWPVVPKEMVERYKRVSWAWNLYAKAPWYGDWPAELDTHLHPQTSLCAGVNESIGGPLLLQEWLEPRWPFELDYRDEFKAIRDRQRHLFEICDMQAQAIVLQAPPASANPLILTGPKRYFRSYDTEGEGSGLPFEINVTKIPYLRRAIGVTLQNIATPNFLRHYEEI